MLRRLLICFSLSLALAASVSSSASAQQSQAVQLNGSHVPSRITAAVNENARVALHGNVHPLAQARYDRGAVAATMPASRLMLLMKHSPTQAAAVREYIDSLQDKKSPNYHKWLTPEQYGAKYGPSDQDLQAVTTWLQSHGFAVNRIAKARNVIEFSGNAGQVQEAFHTSIHHYVVNGEDHFANATDPEIPAALAPVVAGVTQLHNFNLKKNSVVGKQGHWSADSSRTGKNITWTDPHGNESLYVAPADVAVLYNTPNHTLNPSYTGTSYDGTGVTVGIVGDSNFIMKDVANYRAFFLNDTNAAHLPNVIVDGNDPGVTPDAGEAILDNEIVGGVAPGAKINFYTSENTDLQAGLFLAIFRALDDNTADILNVSFGGCEQGQGQAGNQQEFLAWEQAATQGISVTVSTGDSGAASCDNPNTQQIAYDGLAVNGLASTPYAVAVGGTDFGVLSSNYPSSFDQYMNSNGGVAPYYGSVLGPIPETVWNDSTTNNTTLNLNVPNSKYNIVGGGGGISTCGYEDESSRCLAGYAKPAYQTNLTPADGARDLPDVSFFASNGFSFAIWGVCADNITNGEATTYTDCELVNGKPSSTTTLSGYGGTSAAAPAFAGMLALVSQSTGSRLGNVNPVLYSLAETTPSVFHDVTVGNNSVFCESGSPNCNSTNFLTGYDSGTGYDLATGLGSVDATALVQSWPSVSFAPSTTGFQLGTSMATLTEAAITVQHGTPLTFMSETAPGGSVTGNVTLITDTDVTVTPGGGAPTPLYSLSVGGIATGTTTWLPGGSYNVYAYYGGDTSYAASKSNPVPVIVGPEDSTTAISTVFYDASSGLPLSGTVVPYGAYLFATATPQGVSGPSSVPTGTVTFKNSSTALGSPVNINTAGIASYNSQDQPAFPAGTYQLSANYSGDASYNPSHSISSAFTVTKGQISTSLSADSTGVSYGGSVTLTAYIATDSVGNFPTGPITFMSGSTVLGTATMETGYSTQDYTDAGIAKATITGTQFPKNGVNGVTATYAGDANYASSISNGVGITVTGVPTPKIGLNGPATLTIASPGTSVDATMTVTPFGGFTGAVNLTCAVTGPSGAVSAPTCAAATATITGTTATTATVTFATTSTTTAGVYSATVTGADAATGKIAASATIVLTVNPAVVPAFTMAATPVTLAGPGTSAASTVSVTPSGGFTGGVSLTCAASAAGLTCDPAGATVAASGGSASLTIHAPSTTVAGAYSLTVNGVDAATGKVTASTMVAVTVNVAATPSLAIAATPVTMSNPGASAGSTVTLTPSGGFAGTVNLTCTVTASPTGAVSLPVCPTTTASISGTAAVTAMLNIETTSTTTPGSYTLAVTANAGGASVATTSVTVTISAPVVPAGFTLTGTSVTVATLGSTGTSTITLTPAGGFTGQVNLKCAMASAPSGVNVDPTCSFGSSNSVVITASGPVTATMNVATSTTATAMVAPHNGGWQGIAQAASLAGLLFCFIPSRRRKRIVFMVLLLAAAGSFTIGCGGAASTSSTPVNGAGAFTFTVTGTDAASGALVSSTTVIVNVQ
ncbi:hypothetical protein HDF16_004284 [Granulicella aggregans]|uniref:Peptidase S53 domain-containing protein n=1 Tax=Granulicella aggregans TaxID=474949 RepID=A0A7W7ZGR4_9BACT|nr:protease pro-enzyme activation domain-containing protein [Granulicella aggregans]MBB5059558.1 hypothetical protein [Granulicella aggregans]